MKPPADFHEQVQNLGILFDDGDVDKLERYLELLLETNKQFNLTAIKDPDEAWTRHIVDSLSLLPNLVGCEARSVIDVGSGGGLPGLPPALVSPELQMTLLEATGKKARFLEQAAADASNVVVVNQRAEAAGQGPLRETFDAVIARAVGPLPTLLELTVPLARVGGVVLCVKGEKAADEVRAAREALYRLKARVVDLQRTDTGTIVVVEKTAATPKRYPRRDGEPKRDPL